MLNQIEETILGMACFEVFYVWLRFLLCLFATGIASLQLVWLKKYWGRKERLGFMSSMLLYFIINSF